MTSYTDALHAFHTIFLFHEGRLCDKHKQCLRTEGYNTEGLNIMQINLYCKSPDRWGLNTLKGFDIYN